MMKGIRGLLEKDFRLFLRQGGNLFLVLAVVAIFFILTGKMGADFIAVYIPSVMAVYSGNTISYDENGHGYTYLFSLPVNKKIYVREKYILSFIMTVCGWCIGAICAGIATLINPEEVLEKGRIVLPIAILIIFAICYTIGSFLKANLELKESIWNVIGGTGDLEIAIALIVLSLLVWYASYRYSMRVMRKKEF